MLEARGGDSESGLVEAVARSIGWDVGSLWRVDPKAGVLCCVECGDGKNDASPFVRVTRDTVFAPGVGIPGRAWIAQESVTAADVTSDPNFPRAAAAAASGLHGAFAVPLRRGKRVEGVVEFFRTSPGEPPAELLRAIEAVADGILEHARKVESTPTIADLPLGGGVELRKAAARHASVAEYGRRALTGRSLEAIRNDATRIVMGALNADYSAVLELDEDGHGLSFTAAQGWPEDVLRREVPATAESQAGFTLISDTPVVVEDLGSETRFDVPDFVRAAGVVSAASVLLRGRDRPIGVLTAHSKRAAAFGGGDVYFMRAIANVLAAAIERAITDERVRHIARTLQHSLLPMRLPDVPGVRLAARFHAAGEGYEVGGDFYDVFETGRGWSLVIGDVCGKGPEAAALTGLARYTLRAAAAQEHRPSRLLKSLNQALLRQRDDLRFCTLAYVVLDKSRRGFRVRVSCAGHPPPLLVGPHGAVEELCSHGTLLGVRAKLNLSDKKRSLAPGDLVVLYTDGVVQSRDGAEQHFDQEALKGLLRSLAGRSAEEVAEEIEGEALRAQPKRSPDDVAILVAEILPD